MIKAIGWLIKVSFFSILVLVLGNSVKWGGRTVSDQVRTQMAHAERSELAGELKKKLTLPSIHVPMPASLSSSASHSTNEKRRSEAHPQERIASSERQKLRALIQELNTSESADARR